MDLGLKGRVALVCAASQGLGKATAIDFAREGAHTVVCARGKKALLATVKELRRAAYDRTTTVLSLAADLTDPKDIKRLVATTVKRYGRIINITSLTAKQPVNDPVMPSTGRPGH